MQADWTNITDPVFYWARERPDRVAFYEGRGSLTYGELSSLVGKAAVHLHGLGIRAGDRVALSLTNSIDHFILLLGLLRLGATTLEIPYEANTPSADDLAQVSIRTIFLEPGVAPPAGVTAITFDSGWRAAFTRAQGDHRHGGGGEDIYVMTLTSGTTGRRKPSLCSHRRLFARTAARAEPYRESGAFSPERPTNFLATASLGFAVCLERTICHLYFGGAVVILPEFRNAIDLVKAIAGWDDAFVYLPPPMCRFLIACAPRAGFLLPNMRVLIGGGGFLYPQEKLALLDRVTPSFYHSYGSTGFGVMSVQRPSDIREHPASIGKPPSTIEVEIVGADGSPLPAGMVGRLRARGTAGDTTGADGWFYPGDLAHIDAAGYIFLKGRDADVIARAGGEVHAHDVEQAIALHSAVAEVAVVGIPRPFQGEAIIALVVPRGEGQHEAIAAHCRARLPAASWPERVFYVPSLPKTAAGKVDRVQVRAMILDEFERLARAARA